MKNKIIKILFPFFQEHHKFLAERWWFRLLIVFYACLLPVVLITTAYFAFSDYMDSYLACYDIVIKTFDWGSELYNEQFAVCRENVMNALFPATLYTIGMAVVAVGLLYLVQYVFFKVVIDFVVLGSKHRQ